MSNKPLARQTASARLLKAVRERGGTPDGFGIGTADHYIRDVVACTDDLCRVRFGGLDATSVIAKAAKRLTFHAPGMEPTGGMKLASSAELPEGLILPSNTLAVFRNVVTTTREDRDRDVLHTKGARPDPKMPLLWQHIHTLPIGKMVAIDSHTDDMLAVWTALLDLNDLTEDTAKLIEAGALRISHGFLPDRWEERKAMSNDDSDRPLGFDVWDFAIMEESVVSVPSNVDAEITLFSRSQLKNEHTRAHAKGLFDARAKVFGGGEIPAKEGREVMTTKAEQSPKSVKRVGFSPESEQLEACKLEYDWAARFCGCEVKDLMVVGTEVHGMWLGSWLEAEKTLTTGFDLRDKRNLNYSATEEPLLHRTVQLNSERSGVYMVEGMHFYRTPDGKSVVVKHAERWGSLYVTTYAKDDTGDKLMADAWAKAQAENFLKGEAFAVTGGFIKRGDLTFDDVFLEPANQKAIESAIAKFREDGDKAAPRGVVLMGPPGTGKTLSARVVLDQLREATFIWITAKDFGDMGYGAIRQAFAVARALGPAVLFFEDCDDWMASSYAVDLLRIELDGLVKNSSILTMLATNHPDRFPKALIDRPGRFSDVLLYDVPSDEVRERMLRRWTGDDSLDVSKAVERTKGLSGAHIWMLVEFAKSIADDGELAMADALDAAITKTTEQRELIDSVSNGQGPRSWARAALSIVKGVRTGAAVKSGRSISKANLGLLGEAQADLSELSGTDLTRAQRALVKSAGEHVGAVIASASTPDETEDSKSKKAPCGCKASFNDRIAAILGGAEQDELERVRAACDALLAVEAQERVAQAYRELVAG